MLVFSKKSTHFLNKTLGEFQILQAFFGKLFLHFFNG